MAHAALINDDLQIDGFDAYTWSGTYGLPTDGFAKDMFMDGTYTTQISETPTVYTDSLSTRSDQNLDLAGNMYLKTAGTKPSPFMGFPARKLEYDDGSVTWWRPGKPWSWQMDASNSFYKLVKNNLLLLILIIAVLVFFITSKTKLF